MTDPALTLKVAISSEFFRAMYRLPKAVHHKVEAFINQFQQNPTSPGLNYEKIKAFKDPKLRSVRVDQAYRAIVLKPDRGDVYMLLWVDHHDKAYRWAENKVYTIHPDTGGLQVYTVTEAIPEPAQESLEEEAGDLFAAWRDRELVRIGVPEPLLPLVRSFNTMELLEAAQDYLPVEAFEALYYLASGYDYEEIWREIEYSRQQAEVDTEDYAAALERADSQRRFYVVDDEQELARILSAPLEEWRVFLHPAQRKLVEMHVNGPVRVLGGAGTGKTVVAMHRAKKLAEAAGEGETVLFTTFTRNLAEDIRQNLATICSPEVLGRIEVVNLDKWVVDFLYANGYPYSIDYDGSKREPLWEASLRLAPEGLGFNGVFYREEWEQVIQTAGIDTRMEYLRVPRIGRGRRLSRKERAAMWPVFAFYRTRLEEQGLKERSDAFRDAYAVLDAHGAILPYRHIVVDEAQDMGFPAFKLLRKMIPEEQPNDLFIVGDAHQRIYRHKVVLSHCGINIRGRAHRLRINYRTTEENRRWAVALLRGLAYDDLDGGLDDQNGYRSLMHGPDPEIHCVQNFEDEVALIASRIEALAAEGTSLRSVCVVARLKESVRDYVEGLNEAGMPAVPISRSWTEEDARDGVRVATMHRVKGLEFDHVFVAGVNEGIVPLSFHNGATVDPGMRLDREMQERALLYVSATRAKRSTTITSHGRASAWIVP